MRKAKQTFESTLFLSGLIFGLLGGIIGNLLVTSMYRWIDGNAVGNNLLTMSLALFFTTTILILLFKTISKINK